MPTPRSNKYSLNKGWSVCVALREIKCRRRDPQIVITGNVLSALNKMKSRV